MKPLATEINRVLSTKEYGLFKYKINRLNERKLAILIDEMSIKNISKDTPIIVDAEYNILDGRYRFEANKKLISPIYYKVAEVANKLDLMKASSLSTKPTNYEYVLMHQDKLAYRKVLEWANVLPYSFEDIIRLIGVSYLTTQNRIYNNMFKNGEMEYNKEDEWKLNKIKSFLDIFVEKYKGLLLRLDEVNDCLEYKEYDIESTITYIEGLVYFNEFVKLKNEGHPSFQDFDAYVNEANRCNTWETSPSQLTINTCQRFNLKIHKSVLDAALEVDEYWGRPVNPILYALHNYLNK